MEIKNILFIFGFLYIVIFSNNVFALDVENIDFGPTLQILDSSKKEIDISKPILNDAKLVFKLTLTNSLNYWICWENWHYNLKITKLGASTEYNIQESLSGKECLAPNERKNIWILFEEYNKLKEEARLGKWIIEPNVRLIDTKCYRLNELEGETCYGSPYFSGNMREFEVVKEEPTIHLTIHNLWKWINTGYNIIYGLLGFIVLLFSAIIGYKKLSGK